MNPRAFVAVLLAFACNSHEAHSTVSSAIRSRLSGESKVSVSCDTYTRDLVASTKPFHFAERYPKGLFIICGETVAGNDARATVFHLQYHEQRQQVLIASEAKVELTRHRSGWKITGWRTALVEPPPRS
jgi:hypothetical protein